MATEGLQEIYNNVNAIRNGNHFVRYSASIDLELDSDSDFDSILRLLRMVNYFIFGVIWSDFKVGLVVFLSCACFDISNKRIMSTIFSGRWRQDRLFLLLLRFLLLELLFVFGVSVTSFLSDAASSTSIFFGQLDVLPWNGLFAGRRCRILSFSQTVHCVRVLSVSGRLFLDWLVLSFLIWIRIIASRIVLLFEYVRLLPLSSKVWG